MTAVLTFGNSQKAASAAAYGICRVKWNAVCSFIVRSPLQQDAAGAKARLQRV